MSDYFSRSIRPRLIASNQLPIAALNQRYPPNPGEDVFRKMDTWSWPAKVKLRINHFTNRQMEELILSTAHSPIRLTVYNKFRNRIDIKMDFKQLAKNDEFFEGLEKRRLEEEQKLLDEVARMIVEDIIEQVKRCVLKEAKLSSGIFLVLYVECDYLRLPGVIDIPNLKLQSGYLKANENGTQKMFYLFLESRDISSSDAPILIWFNGGPGCSSLSGFFEEFGPFYVNYDGKTLFENPDSWYHKSNILFLESPIGVGFSYDTEHKNFTKANDDLIAQQNFLAVVDFFKKHPYYNKNDFYVAAESYGGVYGPMLSAAIAEAIGKLEFPNEHFKGLIIGNGYMNVKLTTNTMILWSAYHARTSPDDWDEIKAKCKTPGARDVDEYDFTKFMKTKNKMDYSVDNTTECGRLIAPLISQNTEGWEGYDFFNFYQDCYVNFTLPNLTDPVQEALRKAPKIEALLNKYSTDNRASYRCWNDRALTSYLNLNSVKRALKIDASWLERGEKWAVCNSPMYDEYVMTHQDMTPFFERIFDNYRGPAFRILIYSGDVDTACNYLADGYFVRNLARRNNFAKTVKHQPWFYSSNRVIAGYYMRYERTNRLGSKLAVDVVTVKKEQRKALHPLHFTEN
uniref:Carboxypeptidase n=1 Tax=Caenorhabditis japonica TaxID=281687 RepID=A0A8R1DGS5_CAEJA